MSTVRQRKGGKPPAGADGGPATGWTPDPEQGGSTLRLITISSLLIVGSIAFYTHLLTQSPGRAEREPPATEPLDAPRLTQLDQFAGEHSDRLLWGTYRPGLYFGMRMRRPTSLLAGLMWFDPQSRGSVSELRHEAQDRDGLRKLGWLRHDGATFGRQELVDNFYEIVTSFAKRRGGGAAAGGDWSARVSVENMADTPPTLIEGRKISLVFYMMEEEPGEADSWHILPERRQDTGPARVLLRGSSSALGGWELWGVAQRTDFALTYMGVATKHTHNLTDLFKRSIKRSHSAPEDVGPVLPNNVLDPGYNLAAFQLTAPLPFSCDFVLVTGLNFDGDGAEAAATERASAMSGSALTALLEEREAAWEGRFGERMGIEGKEGVTEEGLEVARAAVSNMLGGMGYFYGQSVLFDGPEDVAHAYWPAALYTAVPSRSFFPRGFLWDEGFHQLLISRWDESMSREALAHWLDLLNARGWIPREQILGAEARARVPAEFIVQRTSNANPPTLFLPLASLAARAAAGGMPPKEAADTKEFLRAALPRLEAWFQWFNRTQAGPERGSYRWRGRSETAQNELNPKTLTSGLDDYPRASHPGRSERHLDLRCWMAIASRLLAQVATAAESDGAAAQYESMYELLSDLELLNKQHLHKATGEYRDFGNHTEHVKLEWFATMAPGQPRQAAPQGRSFLRETLGKPKGRLVPQFGYVSLFPLISRLLPADSDSLAKQLELIRDESRLWSPYGLRSLSKSASVYGKYNTEHDAPYWRGAIWMNVNYLALGALHHYGRAPGPHAARALEIYRELRGNLVGNVVGQYRSKGFLFESYDDRDGHGRGCKPFTGWTALITLIMGEVY